MRADRWQTGDCAVYAHALIETRPALRLGAVRGRGDSYLHFFAHDDMHAYDSRGSHELPYTEVWDSAFRNYFPASAAGVMGFRCELDLDLYAFGLSKGERELLPLARQHMRRHARQISTERNAS